MIILSANLCLFLIKEYFNKKNIMSNWQQYETQPILELNNDELNDRRTVVHFDLDTFFCLCRKAVKLIVNGQACDCWRRFRPKCGGRL